MKKKFVMLKLSSDEASALLDVTMKIGGDSQISRRRHFDRIREQLESKGVFSTPRGDLNGESLYFLDTPLLSRAISNNAPYNARSK